MKDLMMTLEWLADHPDSCSGEISRQVGLSTRYVSALLKVGELDGLCQRWREGNRPWLWEICENGLLIIGRAVSQ